MSCLQQLLYNSLNSLYFSSSTKSFGSRSKQTLDNHSKNSTEIFIFQLLSDWWTWPSCRFAHILFWKKYVQRTSMARSRSLLWRGFELSNTNIRGNTKRQIVFWSILLQQTFHSLDILAGEQIKPKLIQKILHREIGIGRTILRQNVSLFEVWGSWRAL